MVYQQYFYPVQALKLIDDAVVSFDQSLNSVFVFLRNIPAYLRHRLQNINSLKNLETMKAA